MITKHFRLIIIIILLINNGISTNVAAQNVPTFAPKINIPTSPEAALFQRFGDIPVGYYTGTANISIPLYTFEESGVSIPVALNYQSSGIKVADEATWVGLGWSLQPEGAIIQEVRGGKKDEDDNFLHGTMNAEAYSDLWARINGTGYYPAVGMIGIYKVLRQYGWEHLVDCSGSASIHPTLPHQDQYSVIQDLLDGHGEPDVYHFNFAGHSGDFYYDPLAQVFVQMNKKEEILFVKSGSSFTAKTLDGTLFTFGTKETAHGTDLTSRLAGNTFKLTQVSFANGKSIDFTYTDAHISGKVYSQSATMGYMTAGSGPTPPSYEMPYARFTVSDIKSLSSIKSADTELVFNTGTRDDINIQGNDNVKKLVSIDVKSRITGKYIKSFQFSYDYFISSNVVGNPVYGKRLKLNAIKEVGYNDAVPQVADLSKPAYQFTYKTDVGLPQKDSFAVDFWGFYNGMDYNTSLLPDLDYFDYQGQEEFKDYNNPAPWKYNYYKANRFANNTKAGAWMLTSIKYPTGGSTKFVYEPHTFENQFLPDNSMISAVDNATNTVYHSMHLQDNGYTTNTKTKSFTISRSTLVTFHNSIYNGAPMTYTYTAYQMNNCKIELKKVKDNTTTILKTWTMSATTTDFQNNGGQIMPVEDVRLAYDPGAVYTVTVSTPNIYNPNDTYHIAGTQCWFHYYDDTGIIKTSRQGGFRIAEVISYSSTNTEASHKKYTYVGTDGKTSGMLLNQFHPLKQLSSFGGACGTLSEGFPTELAFAFKQKMLSADDFGTSGGTMIGYSRVIEEEVNDTITTTLGKKIFTFQNQVNLTSRGLPTIENPFNGLPVTEEIQKSDGTVLSRKIFTYQNLIQAKAYDAVTIVNHCFGEAQQSGGIPDNEGGFYVYTYETYPLNSYWFMTSNIWDKEYFNGNEISTNTLTTYNSNGLPKTVKTTFANSDEESTTYYYAGEISGYFPIESQMISAKMIGIPLITEKYAGTELLSRQETEYANDATTGNHILPKYIYYRKGNVPGMAMERRLTFDQYDSKGNILQYTMENGKPVSLVWGYNFSKPVVKVENAVYSLIPSTANIASYSSTTTYNETQLNNTLASLRATPALANALVTTYAYKHGIGVNKVSNPNGSFADFEYDAFGRLKYVKDDEGNFLSQNEYNFKP